MQPAYSDWQDSVRREGKSFYVNLLYATVSHRLGAASGMTQTQLAALDARVHETFFDEKKGLYRTLAGSGLASVDGNLLALDLGFVPPDSDRGRALYGSLKKSMLWLRGGVPGSNTDGDYPKSWVHLPAKIAGLSHYHDELHWSWLTALSAKIAGRMGDAVESQRILARMDQMATRDGAIAEIYDGKKQLRPVRTLLYHSEAPFSWGAGFVLDALQATRP